MKNTPTPVWIEQSWKDAGFAVRSLGRARGFTLTVLTMLVLGIGVATVVFDLTSWILIFDQPYPHPEQLYLMGFKDKHNPSNGFQSAMHWQAFREQTNVFSEYAAVTGNATNVVLDGEPVVTGVFGASPDFFHTLGIQPARGRVFLPEEYQAGADHVVVISNLFWRKYFHSDPDVLGHKLIVDQQPCLVIGVLAVSQMFPPGFTSDIYRPLVYKIDPESPLSPTLNIIARLKPGVPRAQAEAAMAAVKFPPLPSWATAFLSEQTPILIRPNDLARPETYWVMAVAALLLYAIACLNATNLMLVRLLGRRRELSIRLALGGTRWQIVRLLAIESVGLALAASLIVTLAAHWLFPPLFAVILGNDAPLYNSFWDPRNLVFIAALSGLAGAAVAVVPVWRLLRAEVNPGLKDGGAAAGEGRSVGRVKTALVIFQAAFAVILLAGTGLMVHSFERLQKVDLGFQPEGKLKVSIAFPPGYDLKPEARLQLFERLKDRLAVIPGVRRVSVGQDTLLEGGFWGTAQMLMNDGSYVPVAGNFVGADFPQTAGLVIKKGRWFSDKRGVFEVVINESMAKARFGTEDPIGKSFRLLVSGNYDNPVVGVVADVRETVRSSAGMRFYVANWVYPPNTDTLLLQLDRDPPKEFAGLIRHAIYDFDPKLIARQIATIHEIVDNSMWAERYAFMILKGLSAIALALAVVGLFSVIAYTVDSRMKEFGVRLALGAQPENLHRLVLKRGLTTTGIGVVAGLAGAIALTRFMQSLLFETTPYDPLVYVGVALALIASATVACWLPARRAARVDITKLLRAE